MWVYVTAATVLVASVLFSVVMMLVGVCIKVSRVKSEDPASERRTGVTLVQRHPAAGTFIRCR